MITIKRESYLEVHSWAFHYEERPTKRHKFRITGKWVHYLSGTKPAIPPDVLDEARRKFVETLRVEP